LPQRGLARTPQTYQRHTGVGDGASATGAQRLANGNAGFAQGCFVAQFQQFADQ
jgi:hypothetical protein